MIRTYPKKTVQASAPTISDLLAESRRLIESAKAHVDKARKG